MGVLCTFPAVSIVAETVEEDEGCAVSGVRGTIACWLDDWIWVVLCGRHLASTDKRGVIDRVFRWTFLKSRK